MLFNFLYVSLAHFMICGEQEPLFFVTLRNNRGVENTVLLAFSSVGKDDSKIAQLKIRRERRDG